MNIASDGYYTTAYLEENPDAREGIAKKQQLELLKQFYDQQAELRELKRIVAHHEPQIAPSEPLYRMSTSFHPLRASTKLAEAHEPSTAHTPLTHKRLSLHQSPKPSASPKGVSSSPAQTVRQSLIPPSVRSLSGSMRGERDFTAAESPDYLERAMLPVELTYLMGAKKPEALDASLPYTPTNQAVMDAVFEAPRDLAVPTKPLRLLKKAAPLKQGRKARGRGRADDQDPKGLASGPEKREAKGLRRFFTRLRRDPVMPTGLQGKTNRPLNTVVVPGNKEEEVEPPNQPFAESLKLKDSPRGRSTIRAPRVAPESRPSSRVSLSPNPPVQFSPLWEYIRSWIVYNYEPPSPPPPKPTSGDSDPSGTKLSSVDQAKRSWRGGAHAEPTAAMSGSTVPFSLLSAPLFTNTSATNLHAPSTPQPTGRLKPLHEVVRILHSLFPAQLRTVMLDPLERFSLTHALGGYIDLLQMAFTMWIGYEMYLVVGTFLRVLSSPFR